ncbi:hypothetical protein, conserved, partial [Trypanosoma vivax Y486]
MTPAGKQNTERKRATQKLWKPSLAANAVAWRSWERRSLPQVRLLSPVSRGSSNTLVRRSRGSDNDSNNAEACVCSSPSVQARSSIRHLGVSASLARARSYTSIDEGSSDHIEGELWYITERTGPGKGKVTSPHWVTCNDHRLIISSSWSDKGRILDVVYFQQIKVILNFTHIHRHTAPRRSAPGTRYIRARKYLRCEACCRHGGHGHVAENIRRTRRGGIHSSKGRTLCAYGGISLSRYYYFGAEFVTQSGGDSTDEKTSERRLLIFATDLHRDFLMWMHFFADRGDTWYAQENRIQRNRFCTYLVTPRKYALLQRLPRGSYAKAMLVSTMSPSIGSSRLICENVNTVITALEIPQSIENAYAADEPIQTSSEAIGNEKWYVYEDLEQEQYTADHEHCRTGAKIETISQTLQTSETNTETVKEKRRYFMIRKTATPTDSKSVQTSDDKWEDMKQKVKMLEHFVKKRDRVIAELLSEIESIKCVTTKNEKNNTQNNGEEKQIKDQKDSVASRQYHQQNKELKKQLQKAL